MTEVPIDYYSLSEITLDIVYVSLDGSVSERRIDVNDYFDDSGVVLAFCHKVGQNRRLKVKQILAAKYVNSEHGPENYCVKCSSGNVNV
jgi:hypothetical protein